MGFDLLTLVEKGGCSAKIPASLLEAALSKLPKLYDPNILVGIDTHDDAGVYKINDDLAIIFTTDFFPPICSDAFEFGEIAATNSLSDVYAMGGEPFLALNIALFPSSTIPISVLNEILAGAAKVAKDAGTIIIGGHTIDDITPKFGLAVIGRIHPKKVITNSGLCPGEILVLTKPIGTGIMVGAKKLNLINEASLNETLKQMKILNKGGAEVMQEFGVTGATDITGFGLIGHSLKMAKASKVNVKIYAKNVPLLNHSYEMVEYGCIPSVAFENLRYVSDSTDFLNNDYNLKMLLNDAQTSGGLLMGVKPDKINELLSKLKSKGLVHSAAIGEVVEGNGRVIIE